MADWMLMLLPLLAVPVVLLFRFVGCTPFETGERVDFSLGLDKTAVSVTQGTSTTVTVTVSAGGDYANNTTLSMSSLAGVTSSFAPNPVNPQGKTVDSTLTVSAAPTAAPGSSVVTISGAGTGPAAGQTLTDSKPLTITVAAPPPVVVPDFTLSLTPPSRTVQRGTTGVFTVNINRVGGFSEAVMLSVNPAGPTTFAPNPAPGATSTLSVPVPTNAPLVTQPFTVTGTATGGATRSTNGTITITP
jgi:biopolymer transport protein ExbD